ncbi:MAG: DUF362 domain-containing protein [Clostridiales bacterium]|jgi:uncharacterized Fe-S center protein|nr:DUF362 domain-containing protein [Eubacteriales bacterium]MDH7567118.1 DUF362 domain-containing protein [Clostridiales bacterium]
MQKSKVYFTNFKTKPNLNRLQKLEKLVKAAGIGTIDFKDKFTAIKLHFGEPGNLAYIRPNYVHKIVEIIKGLGGNVFLTDSNTLYSGRRSNAIDHLQTAMENGFNPMSVGCNVIIADGLKGTDYREIEINGKHCKTAKIGAAIADADIIVSVNHFKGHDLTGFGGALKNLGMGSGSRGGKMEMHSSSKPSINKAKCVGCGFCAKNCSQQAISFSKDKKAEIDYNRCIGCGQCIAECQHGAVGVSFNESSDVANEKIAEYAFAVLKDKPGFHVSFIMDVSPYCDCWSYNDIPIVPDIGIAASFDPVALDKACADLVNRAPVMAGSLLENPGKEAFEHGHEGHDKFGRLHPSTNWKAGLKHAEELKMGSMDYELITL